MGKYFVNGYCAKVWAVARREKTIQTYIPDSFSPRLYASVLLECCLVNPKNTRHFNNPIIKKGKFFFILFCFKTQGERSISITYTHTLIFQMFKFIVLMDITDKIDSGYYLQWTGWIYIYVERDRAIYTHTRMNKYTYIFILNGYVCIWTYVYILLVYFRILLKRFGFATKIE